MLMLSFLYGHSGLIINLVAFPTTIMAPQEEWLRIYKKDSGIATATYAQALDNL